MPPLAASPPRRVDALPPCRARGPLAFRPVLPVAAASLQFLLAAAAAAAAVSQRPEGRGRGGGSKGVCGGKGSARRPFQRGLWRR